MALELAELRSFLLLCEHRHFGRTAAALHLSQPALSKQIRRLEERLGGKLLIRRSGGIHLTLAGELLQQQARSLVADADSAEQITRLALLGKAGTLRVGFGVAVLARGLPGVILRGRIDNTRLALLAEAGTLRVGFGVAVWPEVCRR